MSILVGGLDERLQPGQLGLVGLDVGDAGAGQPDAQVVLEVSHGAALQVGLVRSHDPVGPQPGELPDRLQQLVVRSPAAPEPEVHPPPGTRRPWATSMSASRPASLWARSTITVTVPPSAVRRCTCSCVPG